MGNERCARSPKGLVPLSAVRRRTDVSHVLVTTVRNDDLDALSGIAIPPDLIAGIAHLECVFVIETSQPHS